MTIGDTVRVYPHGRPERGVEGTVVLASPHGIAVEFADMPAFDMGGLVAVSRNTGCVVMMLMRVTVEGAASGPWTDVGGGGRYEVEDLVGRLPVGVVQ